MVIFVSISNFDRGYGSEYFKLVIDSKLKRHVLLYYHSRKKHSFYWILRTSMHSAKIFDECFHFDAKLWTKIYTELWHNDSVNENYFDQNTEFSELDVTPNEYTGGRFYCKLS